MIILACFKVKDEGVYCFGGKNKEGKTFNEMLILRFTKSNSSCKTN